MSKYHRISMLRNAFAQLRRLWDESQRHEGRISALEAKVDILTALNDEHHPAPIIGEMGETYVAKETPDFLYAAENCIGWKAKPAPVAEPTETESKIFFIRAPRPLNEALFVQIWSETTNSRDNRKEYQCTYQGANDAQIIAAAERLGMVMPSKRVRVAEAFLHAAEKDGRDDLLAMLKYLEEQERKHHWPWMMKLHRMADELKAAAKGEK